jgi:vacuolar-type H+-ATPase subunit I/STV1
MDSPSAGIALPDVISLTASIASLVLAVVAIWLSIFFYRMTSQLSESTKEAAKDIGASVERLEKLFDKLYSDTFSMMRDTVSDMRKHIWPQDSNEADKLAEEVDKRADEKLETLKDKMDTELSELLKRQRVQDVQMSSLRSEVLQLVDRAMLASREAESEARKETLREHALRIIRSLERRHSRVTAEMVVEHMGVTPSRAIREIEGLRREGRVEATDPDIGPDTVLRSLRPGARHDPSERDPRGRLGPRGASGERAG